MFLLLVVLSVQTGMRLNWGGLYALVDNADSCTRFLVQILFFGTVTIHTNFFCY